MVPAKIVIIGLHLPPSSLRPASEPPRARTPRPRL
jgi:hypothetical protein